MGQGDGGTLQVSRQEPCKGLHPAIEEPSTVTSAFRAKKDGGFTPRVNYRVSTRSRSRIALAAAPHRGAAVPAQEREDLQASWTSRRRTTWYASQTATNGRRRLEPSSGLYEYLVMRLVWRNAPSTSICLSTASTATSLVCTSLCTSTISSSSATARRSTSAMCERYCVDCRQTGCCQAVEVYLPHRHR